ncbi:MAG: LysM peptidoglycan-binding domain-containing protein [Clostridia bacterium]|nr:LysM peptidoglycan-binding domain-containing protein [Clostridia bacterium]
MPHYAHLNSNDSMLQRSTPAQPDEGPVELPTPALPDETPAQPDEGPVELPTPSLPSQPVRPTIPTVPVQRCPAGYQEGVVETGQTFTDLLLLYNVSYNAMRSVNPGLSTTQPIPGTRYCAPPSGSRRVCPINTRSYVMEQNETLTSLTLRFGVTAAALLQANPSLAPGDFLPGRVICLP